MKKTLFAVIACLALMATACQNTGKGDKEAASKEVEAQVKQRVEQMMQISFLLPICLLCSNRLKASIFGPSFSPVSNGISA